MKPIKLSAVIPLTAQDQRLDFTLSRLFPEYSRENLKQWILNGDCYVNNNKHISPKTKVQGGEEVIINANLKVQNQNWQAEDLPIDIVYEDQDLLILNKPNNIVMHPAIGNWQGTILNALLHYDQNLKLLPRAGIIHRLDQDTTGLVIIAKSLLAYNNLILQLKNHEIVKIYETLVFGNLIAGGTINAPIGRDKNHRLKMVVTDQGKPAITHYRILQKFKHHTYLKVKIETGRTHQIRVHMQHIGYPIVGDQLYYKFSNVLTNHFKRQALHAKELHFKHPITNKDLSFTAPLPLDLQNLLSLLQ